jgi:hypothetical protein
MTTPKPEWLVNLLDAAQIVSALFTAGAVMVAVWLARRNESQRLLFFITRRQNLTVSPGQLSQKTTGMTFTIVNAGLLPVQIRGGHFKMFLDDRVWTNGLESSAGLATRQAFPMVLQHGEQAEFYVAVDPLTFPWKVIRNGWWFVFRPQFHIMSTLGKRYVHKVGFKTLWQLKRDWTELTVSS